MVPNMCLGNTLIIEISLSAGSVQARSHAFTLPLDFHFRYVSRNQTHKEPHACPNCRESRLDRCLQPWAIGFVPRISFGMLSLLVFKCLVHRKIPDHTVAHNYENVNKTILGATR